MNDERPPGVLGGLPRTRPHRRSDKRAGASSPSRADLVPEGPAVAPAPEPGAKPRATKAVAGRAPKPRATKAVAARAPGGQSAAGAAAKPRGQKAVGTAAKPRGQRPAGRVAGTKTAAATRSARAKPAADAGPLRPAASGPPPTEAGPLGTAVQAAAELAEIGLMASARALRNALSRLPRR